MNHFNARVTGTSKGKGFQTTKKYEIRIDAKDLNSLNKTLDWIEKGMKQKEIPCHLEMNWITEEMNIKYIEGDK